MEPVNIPTPTLDFKIVDGTWGHKMTKLRNAFKQLTEEDLHFVEGHEAELLVRLQARLGKSETELKNLIRAL